jgi:hypothetical protein
MSNCQTVTCKRHTSLPIVTPASNCSSSITMRMTADCSFEMSKR